MILKIFSNVTDKGCFIKLLQWWITTPWIKKSRNFVWSKWNIASEFVVRPGCPHYVHLQKGNVQKMFVNSASI